MRFIYTTLRNAHVTLGNAVVTLGNAHVTPSLEIFPSKDSIYSLLSYTTNTIKTGLISAVDPHDGFV